MPASTEHQRKFMGFVRAIQLGKAHGSPKAEEAARTMKVSSVREFAKSVVKKRSKQ